MSLSFDDKELHESMESFRAAAAATPVDLTPPPLSSVLLALDGSNQDPLVEGLAVTIARTSGATLHLLYAYEGEESVEREAYLSARAHVLGEENVTIEIHPRTAARSFEQILNVQSRTGSGLVVVCAPYLDDFAALGQSSSGTNLDVLLARSPVPLLIARDPDRIAHECLSGVLLPLSSNRGCDTGAARWALKLLPKNGSLRILAVVDTEVMQSARHLMEAFVAADEVDEATLAGLDQPEAASIIAALQETSFERDIKCHVSVRVGHTVATIAELGNAAPQIVMIACPRSSEELPLQRAQSVIRESRNPVLAVV